MFQIKPPRPPRARHVTGKKPGLCITNSATWARDFGVRPRPGGHPVSSILPGTPPRGLSGRVPGDIPMRPQQALLAPAWTLVRPLPFPRPWQESQGTASSDLSLKWEHLASQEAGPPSGGWPPGSGSGEWMGQAIGVRPQASSCEETNGVLPR